LNGIVTGMPAVQQKLNLVPLDQIINGNSSFTVETIGMVQDEGVKEHIAVQHSAYKE